MDFTLISCININILYSILYLSKTSLYLNLLTDSYETRYAYKTIIGLFLKLSKHDPILNFKTAAIQNCLFEFTYLNSVNFTKITRLI